MKNFVSGLRRKLFVLKEKILTWLRKIGIMNEQYFFQEYYLTLSKTGDLIILPIIFAYTDKKNLSRCKDAVAQSFLGAYEIQEQPQGRSVSFEDIVNVPLVGFRNNEEGQTKGVNDTVINVTISKPGIFEINSIANPNINVIHENMVIGNETPEGKTKFKILGLSDRLRDNKYFLSIQWTELEIRDVPPRY